jgi:dethiobiotin synthetase
MSEPHPRVRLAVTGTDTGVGKTVVAVGLAFILRQFHDTVATLKPVEAGLPSIDATLLAASAKPAMTPDEVRPVLIAEPLAPMVAAARAGTAIDLSLLHRAFERVSEAGAIVVEGAGGLLVPITPELSFARLFARWNLDVVIVAANRLGTINHTLLTVLGARDAGLAIRGIVLKELTPEPADLSAESNADALRTLLPGMEVVAFPWVSDPRDISGIGEAAERSGLGTLLRSAPPPAP